MRTARRTSATLVLNYKHDKFAITPSFQFQGGNRYGAPETSPGIDPASAGCTHLVGTLRYDASTCGGGVVIPNPYTGTYDNLGSFVQPSEFMMNLQLSYDVSPRVSVVGTLANIVNTCWGGTTAPWTYGDHNICSYGTVGGGLVPGIGNQYNPTGSLTASCKCSAWTIVQPFQKYPYEPALGPFLVSGLNNSTKTPFQFYLQARIKI